MMEQGFPPIEAEPVDWVILAGLILTCAGFAAQWKWKLRRGRGALMFLWVAIFVATWLASGQLMFRQFVPDWTWYSRSGLLFLAPATFLLTWFDGDPHPQPKWKRWIYPPIGACSALVLMELFASVVCPPEGFRRTHCKNNLKQIGLAFYNYHDVFEQYPATAVGDPPRSWRVAVLPFLDQAPLYNSYDSTRQWDEFPNAEFVKRPLRAYLCPNVVRAHDAVGRYFTSYVAPIGPHSILQREQSMLLEDITDGTSNTIAVVEACGLEILWTEPRDFDVTQGPIGIDLKGHGRTDSPGVMSGYHAGGVHVLFGDGAVRFLSQKTDPAVLKALLTADGGDDPGEDW